MEKVIIKKEVIKDNETIRFRDKNTNILKGTASKFTDNKIKVNESDLKKYHIHLLDKICIVKENGFEDEIGTVNDFYTEVYKEDKKNE